MIIHVDDPENFVLDNFGTPNLNSIVDQFKRSAQCTSENAIDLDEYLTTSQEEIKLLILHADQLSAHSTARVVLGDSECKIGINFINSLSNKVVVWAKNGDKLLEYDLDMFDNNRVIVVVGCDPKKIFTKHIVLTDHVWEDLGKICIISPHPEDDVLGMGGAIRKCVKRSEDISVLYTSNGWHSIPDGAYKYTRQYEAAFSLKELGIYDETKIHFPLLRFYDNRDGGGDSEDTNNLYRRLVEFNTVFLCTDKDLNGTHAKVFNLCMEAMKQMRATKRPTIILYKGTWDPLPEWTKGLSHVEMRLSREEAGEKRRAIKAHKSQLSKDPHVMSGDNPEDFRTRAMKPSDTCEFAKITKKPCHVEEFRIYDFPNQ